MNVLEVTEAQRKKLLELCKHYLIGEEFTECYWNDDKLRFMSLSGSTDIPWLEVCLLHLPKAMSTPNNRSYDISIRQAYHLHKFYHTKRHVIDYLHYEYENETIWKKR